MKISTAFQRGGQVFFGNPRATVKFWLVELCMTLAAFAPVLFLAEPDLRWLALLAIPLYVLLMLPVRMNAAAVMQDSLEGGSLFTLRVVDPSEISRKIGRGCLRALYLLIWGAPLIAGLLIARAHISGEMDGFTLMRILKNFGGGDLMRGVLEVLGMFLATLLLLAAGCGFHSGDRHADVLGTPGLLKHRRGRVLGCWCCALVTMLPMIVALGTVVVRYMPVLSDLNGLLMGTATLPETRISLIILAVGALLTVPLLPLRSLILAAYVNGWKHADESTTR